MSLGLPFLSPVKRGIALGSGAAKGIMHVPVLLHFEQKGVRFDAVAGSSMGALVGAVYVCGNLKKFSEKILSAKKKDLLPLIEPVFPRHGLLATGRIRAFLSAYIPEDARIEDFGGRYCAVATDYHSGEEVLLKKGNLLDAVCASIAIPGIFVPGRIDGRVLIDGGVASPVPVSVVRKMGANRIVAVNCHPNVKRNGYRTPGSAPRASLSKSIIPENWISFFSPIRKGRGSEQGLPSIIDLFSQALDIMEYQNTYYSLKREKPDIIIEPDVRHIDSLEFERGVEIYAISRAEIEKKSGKIDRFCRRFF